VGSQTIETNCGRDVAMDRGEARALVWKAIEDCQARYDTGLQMSQIRKAIPPLMSDEGSSQVSDRDEALLILDVLYGLFREGYLSPGHDWQNQELPHLHVTDRGQRVLSELSRDPANPDGYLAYLADLGTLSALAESYVSEALATYNGGHHKAAAVMIGCAAEAIILELRDVVAEQIKAAGGTPSKKLDDWRVRVVTGALKAQFDKDKKSMGPELAPRVGDWWSALAALLRNTRNEAGHPASLEKLEEADVHTALHLFHDFFQLTQDLIRWYEGRTP